MNVFRAAVASLTVLAPFLLAAGPGANDQPVSSDQPVFEGAPPDAPDDGPGSGVRGVVSDAGGWPLAETGIAIISGTSPVPEMLWLTADDGSYAIALPPGTFSVSATRDGYRRQVQEVTVVEGETAVLDFQLDPSP